ncbi:hypothetical protein [Herbiconiux daphne]|uniref:Uncharacterized protein n=1 Tax=Herbiconiux daphne TaxID=2970914 RepID=A0ABT2HB98_9MICO|nr:hypothetical protein [Herbiconiux daphne]MCS5737224.1 hypothetical protein [Herbiconiux daphne]
MARIDVRINKPEMQFTFADIKPGHTFWCADGYISIACKQQSGTSKRQAVVLEDGQIWYPSPTERVRPVNIAVIEV